MSKNLLLLLVFFSVLIGCQHPRNFFEDSDDPGLSRLTSRGYNIATFYINDSAFINPYQHYPLGGASNSNVNIQKTVTSGDKDTLSISWEISYADSPEDQLAYGNISILIPVGKNFSQSEFLAWDGKRFPADSLVDVTFILNRLNRQQATVEAGTGNIYFVKISRTNNNSQEINYQFSGLFEGNAGNNIITKGRFDFRVSSSSLNF